MAARLGMFIGYDKYSEKSKDSQMFQCLFFGWSICDIDILKTYGLF